MDSRSKSSRAEIKFLLSYAISKIYVRMSKSLRSFTEIVSFLHNDLFYRFFSPFAYLPLSYCRLEFFHIRFVILSSRRCYRHCRRQSVSLPSLLCLVEIFSSPIKQWYFTFILLSFQSSCQLHLHAIVDSRGSSHRIALYRMQHSNTCHIVTTSIVSSHHLTHHSALHFVMQQPSTALHTASPVIVFSFSLRFSIALCSCYTFLFLLLSYFYLTGTLVLRSTI